MEEMILTAIFLTQSTTFIIGPIAKILGMLMNLIFSLVPNIGLAIIIFTIIIYLCMMPLTVKQQKFSKLSAKMNPEIQAIQKKYKNKKDQDSMQRMQEETQVVYRKYGVSPTGSCVQLAIQMPILFSLYRVINNIPAYVEKIKAVYLTFVGKMIEIPESIEVLKTFKNYGMLKKQFENDSFIAGSNYMKDTFIDLLNKASSEEWQTLIDHPALASISDSVSSAYEKLTQFNNFLGLNIGDSPIFIIQEAFKNGNYLLIIGAALIPILAGLTQFLNVKLMPQAGQSTESSDNKTMESMQSSMKMMNTMMPLMSVFFCFTFPTGMGIYWVAGSVVRSIQQIVINKHIDKMDIDALVKKNVEKMKTSPQKQSFTQKLLSGAQQQEQPMPKYSSKLSQAEKEELVQKAKEKSAEKSAGNPGSIASKANMVKQYNEKNSSSKK